MRQMIFIKPTDKRTSSGNNPRPRVYPESPIITTTPRPSLKPSSGPSAHRVINVRFLSGGVHIPCLTEAVLPD